MKKLIDDLMRAKNYTVEFIKYALEDFKDIVTWIFALLIFIAIEGIVILYKVF